MANSYVIVEFIDIPKADDYLGIDEVVSGLGINEIFKLSRISPGQTKIPPKSAGNCKSYEWTVVGLEGSTPVSISYRDCYGVQQNYSATFEVMGGFYTFCGQVGHITTSHGTVTLKGDCEDSLVYTEFISENYSVAVQSDFNSDNLFTIENFNGAEGSGIGNVKITANFANAFFSVPENFPFVIVHIYNEVIIPDNNVIPDHLVFEVDKLVSGAMPKKISIIANDNSWNIVGPLPNWLKASAMSGNSAAEVNITPINYSSMDVGAYNYELTVNINSQVFKVPITLKVLGNIRNPYMEGNLYFTKEEKSLGFTSQYLNTYIHLELEIKTYKINSNDEAIYLRHYNLPLFQRKGEFYVGDIVEGLLDEIKQLSDFIPDFRSNYVKKQFRPAEIKISFSERNYADETEVFSGSVAMFKMIKGYRPFITSNQLALLTSSQQHITRITQNSVISTSFIYIGKPRIIVKINNQIIEDFEVDESENEIIYSYYRFSNDLKPGDSIEIIIVQGLETRTQRFIVLRKGLESTFFFFENSFGLIECYEFTGRRRVNSTIKNTTTTKLKNRISYEKKVFSDNTQGIVINTGQLLKQDHIPILSLIRSENIWCSFDHVDGHYISIDSTTTKLTNQDTNSSEEDFDIEFNILEDTDASIYPQ